MKQFLIAILVGFFILPESGFSQKILERLESDLEKGQLPFNDYLVYKALALKAPQKLPLEYQTLANEPIKCGTFISLEIKQNWDKLDKTQQALLDRYFQRPQLPDSLISPTGRFKIHYTTTGKDAISPVDLNSDGTPDYAEEAARAIDYCHFLMVDSLGYRIPPGDQSVDGNEYDVYILDKGNTYGETHFEKKISSNPERWITYMTVDNDYGFGFPTHDLDALRVTAAHEYFHAVQLGYGYRNADVFYFEISSTWMEDVAYTEVNDYYFYLPRFFSDINVPFNKADGTHEYGRCLWNHMLGKKYGPDVIRQTWEEIAKVPALEAIDRSLTLYGSTFYDELENFSIWNYFTGSRSDSVRYYPEGAYYPEVTFREEFGDNLDMAVVDSSQKLASLYYNFSDSTRDRTITLIPTNLETPAQPNARNDFSKFRLDVIQTSLDNLFTKIADGVYLRMLTDKFLFWRGNAIIRENQGQASVAPFSPVGWEILEKRDDIITCYPNPFIVGKHPEFKVSFTLSKKMWVETLIFTANGTLVKNVTIENFVPGNLEAGLHNRFRWDGTNDRGEKVASGIYLFCLKTRDLVKIEKFAVVRQ